MKIFLFTISVLLYFLTFVKEVMAVENPLSVPNNKFGIHILFPEELDAAARLVNSNGGDWGYVTIPVQAGDHDLKKWQKFMDDASQYHLIPIIRLAIENDYFNTKVWRKPTFADVLDFANFLASLDWPTKNRYVLVFNEVNRADEWGGAPNPSEYAEILFYAVTAFKFESPDFFIISSGLDNASADIPGFSYNQYTFLQQVNEAMPGIFSQIDGLGSHSYPNPGFSQPPTRWNAMGISSFRFEKELVRSLGGKDLPVFITETGWSNEKVLEDVISNYYRETFNIIWNSSDVVAVTPFILRAGSPFQMFSFIRNNGEETRYYQVIKNMAKIKGTPVLRPKQEIDKKTKDLVTKDIPLKKFSKTKDDNPLIQIPKGLVIFLKYLLKCRQNVV